MWSPDKAMDHIATSPAAAAARSRHARTTRQDRHCITPARTAVASSRRSRLAGRTQGRASRVLVSGQKGDCTAGLSQGGKRGRPRRAAALGRPCAIWDDRQATPSPCRWGTRVKGTSLNINGVGGFARVSVCSGGFTGVSLCSGGFAGVSLCSWFFGLPARGLPGVRDTVPNYTGSRIRLWRRMHARAVNVRRQILDEHRVVEWGGGFDP
jgi:hypothetical protein